jgi:hypothetical protein
MSDLLPFTTSVTCCARCQQDHADLHFEVLANGPDYVSHYGICPTNGQPILMLQQSDARPAAPGNVEAVRQAALRVCDGWVGQHEMGELWRDEVADMEALQRALVLPAAPVCECGHGMDSHRLTLSDDRDYCMGPNCDCRKAKPAPVSQGANSPEIPDSCICGETSARNCPIHGLGAAQLKQQLATAEVHSVELAEKLAASERIRMAEGGQGWIELGWDLASEPTQVLMTFQNGGLN